MIHVLHMRPIEHLVLQWMEISSFENPKTSFPGLNGKKDIFFWTPVLV